MSTTLSSTTEKCPQCGALIPVTPGYINWCAECNWNLAPAEKKKKKNRREQLYENLGKRYSETLLQQMIRQGVPRPRLSLSLMLAFVLATMIHLSTIALALFGIWRVMRGFSGMAFPFYCFALLVGGFCLFMAWELRPRFSKVPKGVITRAEFPAVYQLVDRIAAALGSSPVDHIAVNGDFNASFNRVTWRRQSALQIGYPLWSLLTPQERIALLAHEIGHDVNGDPGRGFYIGTAISTVARWYTYVTPSGRTHLGGSFWNYLLDILFTVISGIVWLFFFGFVHLLWHDSQKAEFKADYLAATISGTAAKIGLLEKLHLQTIWYNAQQRYVLSRGYTDKARNLFQEAQAEMAQIPTREQERLRRWNKLNLARFDVTHPPTQHRIAFLQAHPVDQPQITLSNSEWQQIDQEMARLEMKVRTEIAENYGGMVYLAPRNPA